MSKSNLAGVIFLKILILTALVIVSSLLSFVGLVPRTTEEDIAKNVNKLKKYQWFQDFLSNKEYKELITHDAKVRRVIGRMNSNRIDVKFFCHRYQKKLQTVLHQKLNRSV